MNWTTFSAADSSNSKAPAPSSGRRAFVPRLVTGEFRRKQYEAILTSSSDSLVSQLVAVR